MMVDGGLWANNPIMNAAVDASLRTARPAASFSGAT
jgi:hypothetical protein